MKPGNNDLQKPTAKPVDHYVSIYLFGVTDVWVTENPAPPQRMVEYAGLIRAMAGRAAAVGELETLRRDIGRLLGNKALDAGPLVARAFRYSDGEARQLLAFVSLLIWRLADSVLPGASPDVAWQDSLALKRHQPAMAANARA